MPDPQPALEELRRTLLLGHIREARARANAAEDEVTGLVREAREIGCSWESIGQALGTTRPAAWERYRRQVEE